MKMPVIEHDQNFGEFHGNFSPQKLYQGLMSEKEGRIFFARCIQRLHIVQFAKITYRDDATCKSIRAVGVGMQIANKIKSSCSDSCRGDIS